MGKKRKRPTKLRTERREKPASGASSTVPAKVQAAADTLRAHSETPTIRSLFRGFVQGLVVVTLLIALKLLLETTWVGKKIEEMAADSLQHRLTEDAHYRDSPIKVVDITKLGTVGRKTEGAKGEVQVTERTGLKRVLQEVMNAQPAAIGVDVYFTPKRDGKLFVEDEEFLVKCLEANGQGIPTFVGIYDAAGLGPKRWLGFEQYGSLGAAVHVPPPESSGGKTERLLKKLEMRVRGQDVVVLSLSESLLEAYQRRVGGARPRKRWMGEWLDNRLPALIEAPSTTEDGITIYTFPIDFSLVDHWIEHRIPEEAVNEASLELKDKVVLLGWGTPGEARDTFVIPNHGETVPGVYLQAAATDTLMETHLYRLSAWGRMLADVLAALVPLGGVLVIQLLFWRRLSHEGREALERWLPVAMGVAVLLGAYVCVGWSGIYWTDFVLVAMALFLHGPVERSMKAIFRG